MNRFKKELKKKGFLMENDFPFFPYQGVMAIVIDSSTASYLYVHNCIVLQFDMLRNGTFLETGNGDVYIRNEFVISQ